MNNYCNESAKQNAPISFFAQLLKYLPRDWILQEDKRISPKCNARKFSLWDQLVSLLFCHLAGCDSLREIEDGLISAVGKLQHLSAKAMGRTTLNTAAMRALRNCIFACCKLTETSLTVISIKTICVRSMRWIPQRFRSA